MSLYDRRGVSAQKEEVHAATQMLDKGIFPKAFCKIYPDYLAGDMNWVNVMHADGAGTKSALAYMYWKETGNKHVWRGIAQDAVVMNLDDLLCVGIYNNIVFNSTIDRNKLLIPGEVLEEIITGTQAFFDMLRPFGIDIQYLGGETADVGDVVRTIAVNGTMAARWPREKIVSNEKIQAGDVIVGLASFGQSTYESGQNSGIGSNGLTSARHDVLANEYATLFPMTFEPTLDREVVYLGKHRLTEVVGEQEMTVGQLLLSPTRTYAPVLCDLLQNHFDSIHGLVHCSGGGQTKCLKFVPDNVKVVKDRPFDPPFVFKLIQQSSQASLREMVQVFNMGCRLEVFCPPECAQAIIATANKYHIAAKITGRVEYAIGKQLEITMAGETIRFDA